MTKTWEIFNARNMISPVLIGGFVEKDRALLYMPILVKRSRSGFRAKSVFDELH